jgi:hypothetical protein
MESMSLAFFYLLGQNATYLSASWYGSIVVTACMAIVSFVSTMFAWRVLVAFALGWFSVAYVPEHRLGASSRTFTCHEKTKDHHLSIFLISEIVIFVCVTGGINIDDGVWWAWFIVGFCHVLYIILIDIFNRFSMRVYEGESVARLYFLVYGVILVGSDLFFMIVSLGAYNRSQNLVWITVLSAITFVVSYILENFDAIHKFDFILIDKRHIVTNRPSSPPLSGSNKQDSSEV